MLKRKIFVQIVTFLSYLYWNVKKDLCVLTDLKKTKKIEKFS